MIKYFWLYLAQKLILYVNIYMTYIPEVQIGKNDDYFSNNSVHVHVHSKYKKRVIFNYIEVHLSIFKYRKLRQEK